jgi:putative transposase
VPRAGAGGKPANAFSLTENGNYISDSEVEEHLRLLIEDEGAYYGYVKLTYKLKSFGIIINKKKVYRLCKKMGILRPQRIIKPSYPRKLARNRTLTASNQLWETDIKYGYIAGESRFFYIASLLDVLDRTIVNYHIGLQCTSKDVAVMLKESVNTVDGPKPAVRTDNGPQFTGFDFESTWASLEIEHERIPYKTPDKIAHIESFHRIFEEECLSHGFQNYAEAFSSVVAFMKFYNTKRIHSSIGYMAPLTFRERAKSEKIVIKEVKV